MKRLARWGASILALLGAVPIACSEDGPRTYDGGVCSESAAGDLFERRIAPLLAEERPKSCNECHLSGIDFSMFARSSACESMACLVDQGLVDLSSPERSRILGWIERANPESPLITEQVIQEEYDGFLDWIRFSAACGSDACGDVQCGTTEETVCAIEREPRLAEVKDAGLPDSCSDLEIEQLFRESIYSSRGRCYPCHFDTGGDILGDPPRFMHASEACNLSALETLRHIERGGYMDLEEPEKSLLLLKPLDERAGGVEHGGGAKFHDEGDSAYLNFVRFIRYYADCRAGGDEQVAPTSP
jgi:hypothetical protein